MENIDKILRHILHRLFAILEITFQDFPLETEKSSIGFNRNLNDSYHKVIMLLIAMLTNELQMF